MIMSSSVSTNVMLSSRNNNNEMYIYDLPSVERRALCAILDELDLWSDLAITHMGYDKSELQDIRRAKASGNSPTDKLLDMYGDLNHTVTELFILLYRMQQYTAMDVIKSFVDRKYHKLITHRQPDLSNLLRKSKNTKSEKILNCNLSSGVSNSNNETTNSESYTSPSESDQDSKSVYRRNASEYASTIPEIDYKELLHATNNWSDTHILGKGGFGTVYHGFWKHTAVAIKKITYHGPGSGDKVQTQQILNELKHLNSCRHDNILPLYGYSINRKSEPCLVYQLMVGGSLEQRLNSKRFEPLTWKQRLNIACGTARGLQYLHTIRETPLIHGDIKPANILLDPCNQPKIGDFGLAREGPNSLNSCIIVSRVYGTKPYLPLEFVDYKSLTTKVDTFSFGVVLLEMFTGLRAYDRSRPYPMLTRYILSLCQSNDSLDDLIDKGLRGNPDVEEICKRIINLGRTCIADNRDDRPEMVLVLRLLEGL